MRAHFLVIMLAGFAAGCSHAPVPKVAIKPFTGHVPRIPGNYAAEAYLQKPWQELPIIGVAGTKEHPNASTDYQNCLRSASLHEVNNVAGVEACNGAYGYYLR